jgi:hypothetical protein
MKENAVCSRSEDGVVIFWCPGCETYHGVWTETPNDLTGARWTWNGSLAKPTFTPSILVRSGHYLPGNEGGCWCKFNEAHPAAEREKQFACTQCHSYVTDGKIQFLGDCSHKLAGQTVPLEPES